MRIENKNKLCKTYPRFKSNSELLSKLNLLQEQLHFLIKEVKTKLFRKNGDQTD